MVGPKCTRVKGHCPILQTILSSISRAIGRGDSEENCGDHWKVQERRATDRDRERVRHKIKGARKSMGLWGRNKAIGNSRKDQYCNAKIGFSHFWVMFIIYILIPLKLWTIKAVITHPPLMKRLTLLREVTLTNPRTNHRISLRIIRTIQHRTMQIQRQSWMGRPSHLITILISLEWLSLS